MELNPGVHSGHLLSNTPSLAAFFSLLPSVFSSSWFLHLPNKPRISGLLGKPKGG